MVVAVTWKDNNEELTFSTEVESKFNRMPKHLKVGRLTHCKSHDVALAVKAFSLALYADR